ncbi:hypothetical protein BC835DRAFT_1311725, partial [Cytidiella melzeri]
MSARSIYSDKSPAPSSKCFLPSPSPACTCEYRALLGKVARRWPCDVIRVGNFPVVGVSVQSTTGNRLSQCMNIAEEFAILRIVIVLSWTTELYLADIIGTLDEGLRVEVKSMMQDNGARTEEEVEGMEDAVVELPAIALDDCSGMERAAVDVFAVGNDWEGEDGWAQLSTSASTTQSLFELQLCLGHVRSHTVLNCAISCDFRYQRSKGLEVLGVETDISMTVGIQQFWAILVKKPAGGYINVPNVRQQQTACAENIHQAADDTGLHLR